MKTRLFPLLLCAAMLLTASCGVTPDTAAPDDTSASVTSDTAAPDDTTEDTSVDTSDTTSDTAEPPAESTPVISKEEWDAFGFGGLISDTSYNAVCALLTGDIDEFARLCGVDPAVYDSMRGMKIGAWRLYSEAIPSVYDPAESTVYPVLELEVVESQSEYFSVGTHRIVFDEGLQMTFTKREDFAKVSEKLSHAERYVADVGSDRDFTPISAEWKRQFGLGDFIAARLDAIEGGSEPHSAGDIREYAEKYLGVDPDTLELDKSLEKVDGGYVRIGRGSALYVCEYLSEEIRGDYTVVTVRFYADYSRTVVSRTVEFYLELLDWEFRPIKTVIIEDSEYSTVYYST